MDDELADFVRWSSVGEERFGENALRNVEKNGKPNYQRQVRFWRKWGSSKFPVFTIGREREWGGVSADGNDKEMQLRGQGGAMSRQGEREKERRKKRRR